MRDLGAIQRRFHDLVTGGALAVEPGLVIGPPERVAIYARMYVERLHDVLWDDYPKLVAVLGVAGFRDLVERYVRARPPSSFTVRDAGAALPAYLATRGDLPPWFADLALLERARVDVFDAADSTVLRRDDVAALAPEEFPALAIAWVPASVIVRLGWSVDDLWSAIEDETSLADTERMSTSLRTDICAHVRTVLVWRRELTVVHRTLEPEEALVVELVRGCTIAELCEAIATTDAASPAQRAVELLTRWLEAESLAPGPRAS